MNAKVRAYALIRWAIATARKDAATWGVPHFDGDEHRAWRHSDIAWISFADADLINRAYLREYDRAVNTRLAAMTDEEREAAQRAHEDNVSIFRSKDPALTHEVIRLRRVVEALEFEYTNDPEEGWFRRVVGPWEPDPTGAAPAQ